MRTSSTAGEGSWGHSGTEKCLHNFNKRLKDFFIFQVWFLDPIWVPKENPLPTLPVLSVYSAFAYVWFFSLRFIFWQRIIFPFIKSFPLDYWGRCLMSAFCHFLFTCFQVFLLKLELNWRKIKCRQYIPSDSQLKSTPRILCLLTSTVKTRAYWRSDSLKSNFMTQHHPQAFLFSSSTILQTPKLRTQTCVQTPALTRLLLP